jgi:TP901 family phage tail tape measure protein
MSSLLGSLSVIVGFTTVGTTKATRDIRMVERAVNASTTSINTSAAAANASLLALGRTLTQFATLPLAIIGIGASKMFADFEFNIAKVIGLVGVAREQAEAWGEQMLSMAPKLAKSPKELSDALYFITSSGFKGAEALNILNISAKASAAGLSETKDVANIVTSAMMAYGKVNMDASKAVDVLIATVREGKGEPEELTKAFATVIPVAAKLRVSFGEVGGAIAEMTRLGIPSATAAVYLRQTLFTLLKPSKQSQEAFAKMGLSARQLRDNLANKGLLDTLLLLKDRTEGLSQEMLGRAFPNVRAFMTLSSLLGANLNDTKEVINEVVNSTGALAKATESVTNTLRYKFNQTMASAQSMLIKLGEGFAKVLIPVLESLGKAFESIGRWFNNLTDNQQAFIVKSAVFLAVLGPIQILLKMFQFGILYVVNFGKSLAHLTTIGELLAKMHKDAAVSAEANAVAEEKLAKSTAAGAAATTKATKARVALTAAQKEAASWNAMSTSTLLAKTGTGSSKAQIGTLGVKASSDLAKAKIAETNALKAYNNAALASGVAVSSAYAAEQKALDLSLKSRNAKNAAYVAFLNNKKAVEKLAEAEIAHAAAMSQSNLTDALGLRSTTSLTGAYVNHGRVVTTLASLESARSVARKSEISARARVKVAIEAELAAETAAKEAKRLSTVATLSKRKASILEAEATRLSTVATNAERIAVEARNLAYQKAVIANASYMASTGATYKSIREAHKARIAANMAQTAAMKQTLKAEAAMAAQTITLANTSKASWTAFAAGLAKIPVVPVLIAIGAALYAVYKHSRKLSEEQKYQLELTNSVADSYAAEASLLQKYLLVARNEYMSKKDREAAIKAINDLNPTYLGNLRLETINTTSAKNSIDAYNKSLMDSIRAKAAVELMRQAIEKWQKAVLTGGKETVTGWQQFMAILSDPLALTDMISNTKYWQSTISKIAKQNIDGLESYMNKAISNTSKITSEQTLGKVKENYQELTRLSGEYAARTQEAAKVKELVNTKNKANSKEVTKAEDEFQSRLKNTLAAYYNRITAIEDQKKAMEDLLKTDQEYLKLQDDLEKGLVSKDALKAKEDALKKMQTTSLADLNIQAKIAKSPFENLLKMYKGDKSEFGIDTIINEVEGAAKELETKINGMWTSVREGLGKASFMNDMGKPIIEQVNTAHEALTKFFETLGEFKYTEPDTFKNINKMAEVQEWQKLLPVYEQMAEGLKVYQDSVNDAKQADNELFYEIVNNIKNYVPIQWQLIEMEQGVAKEFEEVALMAKYSGSAFDAVAAKTEVLNAEMQNLNKLFKQARTEKDFEGAVEILKKMQKVEDDLMALDYNKFEADLGKINEKIAILGNNSELAEDRLSLFRTQLRKLLAAGPQATGIDYENGGIRFLTDEDKEKFKNDVSFLTATINKVESSINLMSVIKQGIVDVFMGLGEAVGAALVGTENAFSGLLDSILKLASNVGKVMIAMGVALIKLAPFFPLLAPAFIRRGVGLLIAGGGLILGSSIISGALANKGNKEKGPQVVSAMASGGIVPPGFPNDSYPARLSSGEMVIPKPKKLPFIDREPMEVVVKVEGVIKGTDIHYINKEIQRKFRNSY